MIFESTVRRLRLAGRCRSALWVLASALLTLPASAPSAARSASARNAAAVPASPEARLIDVYRKLRAGELDAALSRAESLTKDVPNFQLAQLIYGDLLLARLGKLEQLGNVPTMLANTATAPDHLVQLRREALVRIAAITETPPAHSLPREFVALPPSTRHAIAVDASRSRLYLFENGPHGMALVGDHYVSVGRYGTGKKQQGDQRTPLGVYFVTSRLYPSQLQSFYGAGALPLNYPNEFDRRLGKTGHGIWLHGVPPQSFARTPQSTDGCVVLANDDIARLLRQVEPRSTPVVISAKLDWLTPDQAEGGRTLVRNLMENWLKARTQGGGPALLAFYSRQFSSGTLDLAGWTRAQEAEIRAERGRSLEIKDLSVLSSREGGEIMVVTFGLVAKGQRTGTVKRQYWGKEGGQWKIFFEGAIG